MKFLLQHATTLGTISLTASLATGAAQAQGGTISSETPAWSPDGSRIVFSAGPSRGHQIHVMSAKSSKAVRLTEGPEQNRWPCWSPDGRTIMFMSDRDGQAELYVMRSDGSDERRLTDTPVHEFAPTWSPRGDVIFYLAEMPGSKQQLFRMNPDGTGVHRIDGDHLYYGRGAWAPNGSEFFIGANRDAGTTAADRWRGRARLFAITADGRTITPVGPDGYISKPAPTPDGSAIVYDTGDGTGWSSANGEWDLWLVERVPGATPHQLTSDVSNNWGAAWSLDGKQLAFSSGFGGIYSVVVMAADGSSRRTLTRTDRLPDAE